MGMAFQKTASASACASSSPGWKTRIIQPARAVRRAAAASSSALMAALYHEHGGGDERDHDERALPRRKRNVVERAIERDRGHDDEFAEIGPAPLMVRVGGYMATPHSELAMVTRYKIKVWLRSFHDPLILPVS